MKPREKGGVCLALGALLLLAALALTLYNVLDGQRAAHAAEVAVKALHEKIDAGETEPATPGEMPVIAVDGENYIGALMIPSLNLDLPVMTDWDYTRLRVSPCRYSGSYLTGDLLICAHNYARHFSPIKWIAPGADVYLIGADGRLLHYTVVSVETLRPAQVEDMITPGDWELTLFTCNTGGQSRCAVRCAAAA